MLPITRQPLNPRGTERGALRGRKRAINEPSNHQHKGGTFVGNEHAQGTPPTNDVEEKKRKKEKP